MSRADAARPRGPAVATRASWDLGVGALLVTLAGLLGVGAVAATAAGWAHTGPVDLGTVTAFTVAVAVGELLRLSVPGEREVAPLATAAGLALALFPGAGAGDATAYGAATTIAAVAVGTLVGVVPHAVAGRSPRADLLAHRLLSLATAAALFRDVPFGGRTLLERAGEWEDQRWRVAVLMLAVASTSLLLDACLAGLARASADHARLRPTVRDELRATAGLHVAVGSSAVLIALAGRPLGVLALPVLLAPLLLTQFALRRYATVRATYRQTVRSLARLTELGGYTEAGHTRRVADLALEVGRDLGMPERELLDLEYAALLHDIGQLSLDEPIPGGATVMAAPLEQRRIADLGAEVVRQAGVLDAVAAVVQAQTEQYRRVHETDDRAVPLASRIIKVVNAYDDLVGDSLEEGRRLDALERIHLGLAYEYDPRVVSSLSRVLSRRQA